MGVASVGHVALQAPSVYCYDLSMAGRASERSPYRRSSRFYGGVAGLENSRPGGGLPCFHARGRARGGRRIRGLVGGGRVGAGFVGCGAVSAVGGAFAVAGRGRCWRRWSTRSRLEGGDETGIGVARRLEATAAAARGVVRLVSAHGQIMSVASIRSHTCSPSSVMP
jgi:hypothetical protein